VKPLKGTLNHVLMKDACGGLLRYLETEHVNHM